MFSLEHKEEISFFVLMARIKMIEVLGKGGERGIKDKIDIL